MPLVEQRKHSQSLTQMSLVEQRKHSQPLTQAPLVEQYTDSTPPLRVLLTRSKQTPINQKCMHQHFKIKLPHNQNQKHENTN